MSLRFRFECFPFRTIPDNLERATLREPLPGVEQGVQAFFFGQAPDVERARAGDLFRTWVGIDEIRLDDNLFWRKSGGDEFVARKIGERDVTVHKLVPRTRLAVPR